MIEEGGCWEVIDRLRSVVFGGLLEGAVAPWGWINKELIIRGRFESFVRCVVGDGTEWASMVDGLLTFLRAQKGLDIIIGMLDMLSLGSSISTTFTGWVGFDRIK